MPNPAAPDTGVYYAYSDYAGLLRRLVIIAIDLAVLAGTGYALDLLYHGICNDPDTATFYMVVTLGLVVPAYLVVIKRRPGTIGFLLTNVRVVDLKGETPGLFRMLFRFLLWSAGPFNVLCDLLWLSGDADRQTLRDKWVGTYVIRRTALPEGRGRLTYMNYMVLGYNLIFREVRRTRPSSANAKEATSNE